MKMCNDCFVKLILDVHRGLESTQCGKEMIEVEEIKEHDRKATEFIKSLEKKKKKTV